MTGEEGLWILLDADSKPDAVFTCEEDAIRHIKERGSTLRYGPTTIIKKVPLVDPYLSDSIYDNFEYYNKVIDIKDLIS